MSAPFSCYDYESWNSFISNADTNDATIEDGIKYLSLCKEKSLPYILSFRHLSFIWDIDIRVLSAIITFPEKYYRKFDIPKKSGGTRQISAPHETLYVIQRWILDNILKKNDVSKNAMGFCNGRSVITHASYHLNCNSLLKIDLESFFPTIKLKRVIKAFNYIGYPSRVATSLSRFCSLNGELPQGAPTSPAISNLVVKKMDYRLERLSEIYEIKYSRYADDLAFSGKYIPATFLEPVKTIITNEGFVINNKKTYLTNRKGKKILTGISISDNKLKLPRDKRRRIRAESFNAQKKDPIIVIMENKDPVYYERLLGKLNFWAQIEPDNIRIRDDIENIRRIIKSI